MKNSFRAGLGALLATIAIGANTQEFRQETDCAPEIAGKKPPMVEAVAHPPRRIRKHLTPVEPPWGINDDMSICYNYKQCRFSDNIYQKMKEANMKHVRYTFYWSAIAPAPFLSKDWRGPDHALEQMAANGMDAYGNFMWGPASATGEQQWWIPWHCYTVETGAFRSELPECTNPAPLDTVAYAAFVQETVLRYPQIKDWCFLNEMHDPIFWPPIWREQSKPLKEQYKTFIEQVHFTGMQAVKTVCPDCRILAPEAYSVTVLRTMLEMEDADIKQGKDQWFDIITHHMYFPDTNYPIDALAVIETQIKPLLDKYGRGRPFWITEAGCWYETYNPDRGLEWQAQCYDNLYKGMKRLMQKGIVDRFYQYKPMSAGMAREPGLFDIYENPRPSYYVVKENATQ